MGLLTGMRLITGLELLFWFLAMITRICFKFEGKEKKKNKITAAAKESDPFPQTFKTTARSTKASDEAKQNRIDELEDTMMKMNLKLETIENELRKIQ